MVQFPTQKKLMLVDDELKQTMLEYISNYIIAPIIALQNTTAPNNTFYTSVNNIVQEPFKDIAITTDYKTFETLGNKEF